MGNFCVRAPTAKLLCLLCEFINSEELMHDIKPFLDKIITFYSLVKANRR